MTTYEDAILATGELHRSTDVVRAVLAGQQEKIDSLEEHQLELTDRLTTAQDTIARLNSQIAYDQATYNHLWNEHEELLRLYAEATALKVHEGDLTVTTAGAVIEGLEIRGFLRIKAPDVTARRCKVVGPKNPTGAMALIQAASTGTVLENIELNPQTITPYLDGIVGREFTIRKSIIRNVVDGIKITGSNVLVEDVVISDLSYFAVNPWGTGDTHTDNVQIGAGDNITLRRVNGSGARNAWLMVTQDNGVVSNLVIEDCDISGGAYCINIIEKGRGPIKGLRITDNRFGAAFDGSKKAIIAPLTTSSISVIERNFYPDGSPIAVKRGA